MYVESLFINIPVDETIKLICDRVYRSTGTTPLNIPEAILSKLLEICTKEAPFYAPDGKMYVQVDGVAMGSLLGVLFANFYMGELEERIFSNNPGIKPPTYLRYIDDIFLNLSDQAQLTTLLTTFRENSVLNFTHELENNKKLPFLDALVDSTNDVFTTQVYVKSTNLGLCLSGRSECPERYKSSVIRALVNRAYSHCSTWEDLHSELTWIITLLVNNGYSQQSIDHVIRRKMDKFHSTEEIKPDTNFITIYYKGYMNTGYKEDEKAIKNIIHRNVTPTNNESKIKIVIYYKTRKTCQLAMKNSCLPSNDRLQESHVVYEYQCNVSASGCCNAKYIGMTSTTLSKRLTAHLQDGAIKNHVKTAHGSTITRKKIEEGTTIRVRENDAKRLRMAEAVLIYKQKPKLNVQLQPATILPTSRKNNEHLVR